MSQEKNNTVHGMLTFRTVIDFRDKLVLRHGSNGHVAVSRRIILDIS